MSLFDFKDLNFTYPLHDQPALKHISFTVDEGEFLVISGKSGCGKSTLLRHFKTAITPYGKRSGQILFEGRELSGISVREQASRIGFVLQSPRSSPIRYGTSWPSAWRTLATILRSFV